MQATRNTIQKLVDFLRTEPLLSLGLLLMTLLLAGGDLLELSPSAEQVLDSAPFAYYHRVHEVLAIGFVLLVAYFGTVTLGGALLGVFFLVHVPYLILTFRENGPEHVALVMIIILGIGFLGMASKLHTALNAQQNIADTLQEALLTVPDRINGVDFAHLYNSATEMTKVGGDFYDLFERQNHTVGIMIGDVSGKGLEAATLTALIKNTIRAYAYEHEDAALVLDKTNKAVAGHMPSESTFVTVVFGVLDTKTGILTYANAGHPPPVVKQSKMPLLGRGSPPIGIFPDAKYGNEKVTLQHGDAVVLYTDGVIEARSDEGMFGEARLITAIKNSHAKNVEDLTGEIFNEVYAFSGGHLSDDLALLVLSLDKENSV